MLQPHNIGTFKLDWVGLRVLPLFPSIFPFFFFPFLFFSLDLSSLWLDSRVSRHRVLSIGNGVSPIPLILAQCGGHMLSYNQFSSTATLDMFQTLHLLSNLYLLLHLVLYSFHPPSFIDVGAL